MNTGIGTYMFPIRLRGEISICPIPTTVPAAGAALSSGLSAITTPEKSLRLRTAGSRESRSSTRPDTVAAPRGSAARLKQISQRKVIVIH